MFDLLFPTYCINCGKGGEYLCTKCQKKLQRTVPECYMCRRISNSYKTHNSCNTYGIDSLFVGWQYNDIGKKILSQFKYKYSYNLAMIISHLFIKRLKETNFLDQINPNSLLIPIPIHRKHLLDRGFNQSMLIAQNLSKEFNIKIEDKVLYRKGSSQYQAKSNIEDRKKLKDIFYLKKNIINQNIILIDDVVTTSTTMNNAALTLKGNQIKALALFRGKPRYYHL